MSQNKLISILAAVLLLVVVSSVVILWRTPNSSDTTETTPASEATSPSTASFPVDVLQRQAYQLLNKQLVREGALPVQPAATSGKANPFL